VEAGGIELAQAKRFPWGAALSICFRILAS
jgi:hypothetical protein